MNYLTDTIELAKNVWYAGDGAYIGPGLPSLEAFRALCIRAHMDKLIAECGVEPVATVAARILFDGRWALADGAMVNAGDKLFDADQLAAAVSKAEMRGAENERQRLIAECGVEPCMFVATTSSGNMYPADNYYTADQLAAAVAQRDWRIAVLQDDLKEQCRINGIGSEREAKLLTRIVELETQIDELKGKND